MAELPDDVYWQVTRLSDEGNALANDGKIEEALSRFEQALSILPPPEDEEWNATMWLLAAIGDMQFQLARFTEGRRTLMQAMKLFDEARSNSFIRLRLGQCMLEIGEEPEAANWLAGAFLSEGAALFEGDDQKYLAFIKSTLKPPPGGWPHGW